MKTKVSLLLFMILLGIGMGIFGTWYYDSQIGLPDLTPSQNAEIHEGGYSLINPLLECNNLADNKELVPFKNRLQAIVEDSLSKHLASHVAIYFRDMNNGPWTGINEQDLFAPASLLKVPLMMAYLRSADDNPGILSKKLRFDNIGNNNTSQFFKPLKALTPNDEYTVDDLLTYMIEYSENNAFALLTLNADDRMFSQIYQELGVSVPGISTPQDFITVKQYASFFRILFNASYLSRQNSEKALTLLSNTHFDIGLTAGVPKKTPVAHKFGERNNEDTGERQLHDCGIIYYPKHPYLLCIMTRGNDYNKLASVIRQISKTTYQQVDSQLRQ